MARDELRRLLPTAPRALRVLLDGARGPLQEVIRSEIFGQLRFAQHGRSLALTHRAARAGWRDASFFPRLRSNIRILGEAQRFIGAQHADHGEASPAAEWLLDNFHLIAAQLKEIHEGLPRGYFRELPVLLDEPLAGLPRVYGVAWAFVAHTDGAFDEDMLVHFLQAYQEERELNLSEMWALPTTLRVVLIENLRRLAERVAAHKAAREVANLCCDQIEGWTAGALDALRLQLSRRGVDRVFLAQMALRFQSLRTSGDAVYPARLQVWLRHAVPDLAALQVLQDAEQTADNLSMGNAVTSLRMIGHADWPDIVARASVLMQVMLASNVFAAEDIATRDQALHGIEKLARRSGRGEVEVARTLLGLMNDPQHQAAGGAVAGHWLDGPGQAALQHALGLGELGSLRRALAWRIGARRWTVPLYLATLCMGSFALMAWVLLHFGVAPGGVGWIAFAAVLMLYPASETISAVANRLISESAPPHHLPRLALRDGIPAEHRVLVVIPVMLNEPDSIRALVHRLELHHLANPERHAQFGLLSDWTDADTPEMATDDALLALAHQGVRELNLRHPLAPEAALDSGAAPRFILLHRARSFSATEQRWIGWERKRGKLEQLIRALAEGNAGPFLDLGSQSRLAAGTRYVVTLDSDTQMPPGRLRDLVGVAAHPHNQPKLAADGRRVVSGYGILQPRIVTPLPAPREFTLYHWLFAGQCGMDPYSATSSEVYQDLFGEGSYSGKGLLHVQAMHAVLSGRLPDGLVLSHDLIEGSIARCAVVTDITLVEDAPFHADVAASRLHRWTRGDWQLLPFLVQRARAALRPIHRWKMIDNLRRSLVAPMSLALLLLALADGVVTPAAALVMVMAAFSAGPLMGAVAGFLPPRSDLATWHFYRQAAVDLARVVWGVLWQLQQLLQQALMGVDAVVRALWRMVVSRRHLLQWTTAEVAQAQAVTDLAALARAHWKTPVVALLLLAALLAAGTPTPAWAAALCLFWASSPIGVWWVSRRRSVRADDALPPADQAYLHGIARDTWRYFERCIGPQDHDLPPDNLQTAPYDIVAHRTSPTNIGLYLLSVACARQFGWIGTQDLLARMEATLATLDRLPRHRGHFLNWYDTQTLVPLPPLYVSSVDSGNLGGHLLAVAQACVVLAVEPLDGAAARAALQASRQRLNPLLAARRTGSHALRDELRGCLADHRATVLSAARDAQARSLADSAGSAGARMRLLALARRCETLAGEADFSFLYHRRRHLFHIGYRVADQQLDTGFYDLLASESRLTSLLAIAKGDVPVRHWASLGRPFYAVGASAGLRSWSGSMFEYLMPTLVLDEPHGSVLRDASRAALTEQMAFARAHGVPWGISESAYAGSDHTLAYQYAPQGVPRLALRRTPADELVIAPYATALAAQIAPHLATLNFRRLQTLGARSRYGFIEALDFTPARQTGPSVFTQVHTYMAHHQGMSIVALANVLQDGVAQGWCMAHASIEAAASLLHERAPRAVSRLYEPPVAPLPHTLLREAPRLVRDVQPGVQAVEPTHLLSNGRYSVTLRPQGGGDSRWGSFGLTRGRDDALRDAQGSFLFLRRAAGARPVSLTRHPARDASAVYGSTFHADRVCYEAAWVELRAQVTVWVSPEDDIEFRQVELRNLGEQPLELELISAFEPTMADPRADEAHPAFSNLFVRAEWQPEHHALVFERKPRLPTERAIRAAHFLAEAEAEVTGIRIQTDRQAWLGRNRRPNDPLATLEKTPIDADAAVTLDTGLDPMCALAVQLHVAPGAVARVTFATAASDHAGTLHAVIDKYRQASHIRRASLMSTTLAGIRLRELGISADNFAAVQLLTTALVSSLTRPPSLVAGPASGDLCDRRLLWRFGISGERPLILVTAVATQGLGLLRALAQALRWWSWGGIACDLVVVNAEPASYQMALQREIATLRDWHADAGTDQRGISATGFHLLRADELSSDERATLQARACVRFDADGRPLSHHVQQWSALHQRALDERRSRPSIVVGSASASVPDVATPIGEFDPASGDFGFEVGSGRRPRRPWINVLANPSFGTQVSDAGGGYTWALNSRMNQLTGWSNDPVADPPSEWFLLQDLRTQQAWSVAPSAWGAELRYRVTHGQGESVTRHRRGDLEVHASCCVDARSAVKQVRLALVNRGTKSLQLRVVGLVEWVMGASRTDRATVQTSHQRLGPRLSAVLATQHERAGGFGQGTAFFALAAAAGQVVDWTCDRREFFDVDGRLVLPQVLGQQAAPGLDPCAALSTRVTLAAGASAEAVFLLGYAENAPAALQLAAQAAAVAPAQRLVDARLAWDRLLGACSVRTPDPLFDVMVNRWLLYQAVACRIWAKAGFYQAGGATGFRDQLQDAMALAWAAPGLLREQIVLCASRQFAPGDVQHWWHAPGGAGVRTHFSDDLLWLPYALVHYLRATDDETLLDEQAPFLDGPEIPPGAEDAYFTPTVSSERATVYEHAARTLDRSLRVGVHGLPLMGSGDWNDGMNRVGHAGRGESVWLGWFLCRVAADFAPWARRRGEVDRAQRWEAAARGWTAALGDAAWDGLWFRRAFFDDGHVLGSLANDEARIDLVAQAWAVLSGVASRPRQELALAAVEARLVDPEAGLIRLLHPPLQHAEPSAGYIQAYPPGVRENGGQYSHAAIWALMARAAFAVDGPGALGGDDLVYRDFTWLSPAHRASHPTQRAAYAIEPYVMAGDVYSQPPHVGRGGWSWYTGAAAWMQRAAIESIFGLRLGAQELSFKPCLPTHWGEAELTLRRGGRTMRFVFLRATVGAALLRPAAAGATLLLPGQTLAWTALPADCAFVIPLPAFAVAVVDAAEAA